MVQKYVEKAAVLIEALPYIKRFRGKEVLVKYGGAAMTYEEVLENVLQDLVFMNYVGIRPILIHGGGKKITENLKKAGIATKFVNGLRVTDEKSIKIVAETLVEINQEIVSDFEKLGAKAVGLSGFDSKILNVTKHVEEGDVGFVGDVKSVNFEPIRELTDKNIIPVIYPLGFDDQGQMYNVNADEAASKIAAAMPVRKIMILTNVKGILRNSEEEETLIPSLHLSEVETLIKKNIISGGMIPKVKAGIHALQGGVKKAHIVDAHIRHALLLELFTDEGIGTEIIL